MIQKFPHPNGMLNPWVLPVLHSLLSALYSLSNNLNQARQLKDKFTSFARFGHTVIVLEDHNIWGVYSDLVTLLPISMLAEIE